MLKTLEYSELLGFAKIKSYKQKKSFTKFHKLK